ncbi:transketolase [Paenilisteria newyorkensis]|uniref:transketolase n=1 Tax=Listeria newyorkensis TaxID=1497681 RepID=UPI00051D2554|nr:transketolase [Listeria newyorkensis]KGL39283.1 transketolase [Listeria newyorkensis]WAO22230.1 transketolase [Listeria newyorkensis]SQC54393.1 Transketolase [Listeria newyorkensis]
MSLMDQQMIKTLRVLSMDMVEQANSGHPGLPMGAAPMAFTLWKNHLKFNPAHPSWFNRDRFILSAGHGSALLYSLLHVFGYDVSKEDLRNFRQKDSATPGHPEFGHTPGVDATTGPLGQGIAMGVGMAMSEAHLAGMFNKESHEVIDHHTYVLCGDGCLMEGISYEASSLAGHLQLGKLIVLYDSNDISLDGELSQSFSEDIDLRFRSAGWQTLRVPDGNDVEAINSAILLAKAETNKPTLIEIKTVIGDGSPSKAGTAAAHGAPLGKAEIAQIKKNYGWELEPFELPKTVGYQKDYYLSKGNHRESKWLQAFNKYRNDYPEEAEKLQRLIDNQETADQGLVLPTYTTDDAPVATRDVSGTLLNELAPQLPSLFGGSADLSSSNKTMLKNSGDFLANHYEGKNIWFGVREFAMGGILNGMALHGGIKPYGATFFVFSDYLRSAIRSAALMNLPVTYVMTHDSIMVGEDGPTHEPIEHLASFRAMPNLVVLRPADANETVASYKYALTQQENPVMLVLSRQALPILPTTDTKAATDVEKGAYILAESPTATTDMLLIATGSEVSLAMEVRERLATEQIGARVISMPSWELFERQSADYQEAVLPSEITHRIAIEMASSQGWHKYVGDQGKIIAIDTFGKSGPGPELAEDFGFSVEKIADQILATLQKN